MRHNSLGAARGGRPPESPVCQRRGRGFTLLEVVVAGFVLTIASVGLAVTLAQGASLAKNPRDEMTARQVVQGVLAEIQSTPFPQVGELFHERGFAVPGLKAVEGDGDGLPGEIEFGYGPEGDISYYTVKVRIRWQAGGGERSIESMRYVANVRGDTGTPRPLVGVPLPTGTSGPSEYLVTGDPYPTELYEPFVALEPDPVVADPVAQPASTPTTAPVTQPVATTVTTTAPTGNGNGNGGKKK
ncbi:MAG: type IV pilus modification PilV family protein [Planctomycetaceae bacterium]